MNDFVKVARVDELPPGGRMRHEFEDDTVLIFNVGGRLFAIADLCTHDDGPLGDGLLSDHDIECPRHGARFDIRTGKVLCLPAVTDVPSYAVKVEDGYIYLESPDAW